MRKLILILLLAAPLAAQNYGSYNNAPVERNSFLRVPAAVKGNMLQDSSLVGWWPLTAATGSTARDMSGNGNDGAWSGTKAGTNGYWSAGKTGQWSGYSTTALVTTPTSVPTFTNYVTIALWAKWVNVSAGDQSLIAGRWGAGRAYLLELNGTTYGNYVLFAINSGTKIINSGLTTATSLNGKWSHIAGVYDGSHLTLYINAIQVGQVSATGPLNTASSDPVSIGGTDPNGIYTADVRIYNRALSQAEIQAIYNAENR
jgi:hypothetical protein